MRIQVTSDTAVINEAAQLLMRYMSPSKFVRVWSALRQGQGDYLAWRDEHFGASTVERLYEEVVEFQTARITPRE